MALRETITSSTEGFPATATVSQLLFERAESEDEGVRAMVGKCLGGLAIKDQEATLLPKLQEMCESKSERMREVVITALRVSFVEDADWRQIEDSLGKFFVLLNDPSLTVRQQAVLTLDSLIRTRVGVIHSELLSDVILPALYKGTNPIKELIKEVNYGNFKETVDDGLSYRRCVFQALGSLVECDPERLDMQKFISEVEKGMVDTIQIQMMTMQIFEKLGRTYPSNMLEILESLPKKIMPSVKSNIKASKNARQGNDAKECLRALMKLMLVFNAMSGVEACTAYNYFFKQVMQTPILKTMLEELKAEQKPVV